MDKQVIENDKVCRLCGAPNWYFLEYCHECHKRIADENFDDEFFLRFKGVPFNQAKRILNQENNDNKQELLRKRRNHAPEKNENHHAQRPCSKKYHHEYQIQGEEKPTINKTPHCN
jgi:hypothetical protein